MRPDARKFQAFERITADPVTIKCGSVGNMFRDNSQQPPVELTGRGDAAANHKSTDRGSNDARGVRSNNSEFSTFPSICRLPLLTCVIPH